MSQYQIAIIGAGPAGYFAAQSLHGLMLKQGKEIKIDIFEKLPTPWGLVRSGVAPDHQKIKSVSNVFENIMLHDSVRLVANVQIGKDISLNELRQHYDSVVIAVGTPKAKKIAIPGEQLRNVFTSEQFVGWYNGHPDFSHLNVNLQGSRALIIGAGNVALDVARILSTRVHELEETDISEFALQELRRSKLQQVMITSRRGPEFVSFTSAELKALLQMDSISVGIDKKEIMMAYDRIDITQNKSAQKILELFMQLKTGPSSVKNPELQFKFFHRPISIHGTEGVDSVMFESLEGAINYPFDLVVTAVGYQPQVLSDLELSDGCYLNNHGKIDKSLYVVGWAKHGSQGTIGSTKSDSARVMTLLVQSLSTPKERGDFLKLLNQRNTNFIDKDGWQRINREEILRGTAAGKPRLKFLEVAEMLEVALPQSPQIRSTPPSI